MKDITKEMICDVRYIDDVIAKFATPKEELIRCKDCKWCETFYHGPDMGFSYECTKLYLTRIEANDFCSKAERKEE